MGRARSAIKLLHFAPEFFEVFLIRFFCIAKAIVAGQSRRRPPVPIDEPTPSSVIDPWSLGDLLRSATPSLPSQRLLGSRCFPEDRQVDSDGLLHLSYVYIHRNRAKSTHIGEAAPSGTQHET